MMADFTHTNGEPKGPPQACLFVANLPSSSSSSSSPSSSSPSSSPSLSSVATNTSSSSPSSSSFSSPSDVSEERIKDHFSQFGEVLKVKLIKDRSSRPYAFVQFKEVEDAGEALKSNKLFEGKRLRVERAKVNRTLFIAKLSRNTTNGALREQAEKFGEVESVTIIKNHQTNRSKGCGFVKYTYREDAMDAFVGLKNVNHKWVVEWATSTNDPDTLGVDKFNVFLGGLNPDEVSREAIERRFAEFGDIEGVSLVNKDDDLLSDDYIDSNGQRSAFAFVRFSDSASSAAAIEAANGSEWLGRRIRVQYCESAEMKSKRRQAKYIPQSFVPMAPFYGGLSSGPSLDSQRAPMMMMGGISMYNMPVNPPKSSYQTRGDPLYTGYPMNPSLMAYSQQPWLFAQLQQQQQQAQQVQQVQQQQLPLHFLPQQPMQGRSIPHMHPSYMQHPHFQVPPTHVLPPHHSNHINSHPFSSSHPQNHHPHHQQQHPNSHSHSHHNDNHHNNHNQHLHQVPQQVQQVPGSHSPGHPLPSLQRNRTEGSTSPTNSDDSTGLDGDGGLTQSIAGWVLK